MSRLVKLLQKNTLTLIVDLPENSVEVAKAAIDGGADALHMRLRGSLKNEKKDLSLILSTSRVPVGIQVEKDFDKAGLKYLESMGFDYIAMPIDNISKTSDTKRTAKIAEIDEGYSLESLIALQKEGIDALDAAIIPKRQYGKDLIIGDLQQYITICISSNVPVIVPTERKIRTSEVSIIWDTGVKGLLLEQTVIGKNAKSIKQTTSEFRAAIDDLGE